MLSVNFNPLNCLKYNIQKRVSNSALNPSFTSSSVQDVFVRKPDGCKLSADEISEDRIREIYDECYREFLTQNPILNELYYQKPKLVFSSGRTSNNATATYTAFTNKMQLYVDNINSDIYLIGLKDEKGEYIGALFVRSQEEINILNEVLDENMRSSAETYKLSPKEKELWLKNTFVHELRHWLQSLLVLSTDECAQEYKSYLLTQIKSRDEDLRKLEYLISQEASGYEKEKKGSLKESSDTMEQWELQLRNHQKLYRELKSRQINLDDDCISDYIPKKILPSDTTIPVNAFIRNKYRWSVRDHFLPRSKNANSNVNIEEFYASNPREIDAYMYGGCYLRSLKNTQARQGVLRLLILFNEDCVSKGLGLMEKYGYPPIIG